MMKRMMALLLLACTVFILCACPGGGPVDPPVGGDVCDVCGKNPCECEQDPGGGDPPVGPGTVDPGEVDLNTVFGDGNKMDGAGDSLASDAAVLTEKTYDEASAVEKAAGDIFRLEFLGSGVIRATGTSAATLQKQQGKTYAGSNVVLILPKGLGLANNESVTLKNAVIVGDVEIASGSDILFENVQFHGKVTIKNRAEGVVFKSCRVRAIESAAKNLTLVDSYVGFEAVGIESTGDGLYVKNCRLEGTGTAIRSSGADAEIRLCTIKADKDGIGVEILGAEAVNTLVALSAISGVQKSVAVSDTTNTAVVRNSLVSVFLSRNTSVYICDNELGGRVHAEENNYFLADGNAYPADELDHRSVLSGNENINGDTITNVNERLEVGANEALLPHVNKDLHLYMDRKKTVKEYDADKESTLYSYIMKEARSSDVVIVAPGAYAVEETASFTRVHNNTTIYAYGVLAEGVRYSNKAYNIGHVKMEGAENIVIKGLSVGYAQPSCGQIYILEKKGSGNVLATTGAGFWNDFATTNSTIMYGSTYVYIFREGTDYCIGEAAIKSVAKNSDGTMTLSLTDACYDLIDKGDVLACRIGAYSWVVHTIGCKDVELHDFTQFGYAGGYAFYEVENENGVLYNRVTDTTKAGMLIDKTTYDKYKNWQDQYGVDLEISRERVDGEYVYRGPAAKISSLDGVHATSGGQGSQLISCVLEGMCDDATNMNAYHARLSEVIDNEDGTATLVYKACLTSRLWGIGKEQPDGKRKVEYIRYCADFREGDRVYIYNAAGQLFCDTAAISDGWEYDTIRSNCDQVVETDIVRYAVKVNKAALHMTALDGYDLTDDSHKDANKVLVDNMSRSSADILYDNTLFQNGQTNAVRAKCGVVKHCTIRNIAKTAFSAVYDIWWGESVVADGFLFENNLIDHTGYNIYTPPTIESPSSDYKYTPICIMGLGGSSLDEDHLLFKDITIKGNKFINRDLTWYNYLAYIRAATNVKFIDNDFGESEHEDGLFKFAQILYLNGAANIELSGNTYSPFIDPALFERPDYTMLVDGDKYKDIHGTDVSQDGVSKIADKLEPEE